MWLCSCGCVNFSANQYCPASLTWKHIEHKQISPSRYDFTMYLVAEGRVKKLLMTPNEELHAQFFSEEAILVATMDDVDLDEHIHQLETIAREAKARLTAASEEKRNRAAKAGTKKWKVEPIGPDPTVTDSLNKVKQRSARMGKLDKMRASMAALGIPDSELDQMLAKMLTKARKEPAALREEERLKKELGQKEEPSIITEEERLRRIEERKRLDAQDKAIEAEAKKNEAPVHSSKDEKPIITEEPPVSKEPITGKPELPEWLKKLKFT